MKKPKFNNLMLDKNIKVFAIWKEAQRFFERNFVNKQIVFIYKRYGKEQSLRINFEKRHFLHLLGIKYTRGSVRFWDDLKEGKIALESISPAKGDLEIFKAKLEALKSIEFLLSEGVRITRSYDTFRLVGADNLIQNKDADIAIATRSYAQNKQVMVSLLNNGYIKNTPKFPKGAKVIRIISFDDITDSVKTIFDISK